MCNIASNRRLPQELFDIIIDNLHSDKDTLKECSLVCRSWVPSSSFHLLRRVAWPLLHHTRHTHDDPNVSHQDHQSLSSPDPIDTSFRTCLSILKSSARLQSYVREFALTSHRPQCSTITGRGKWEKLDVSTIAAILDLLPYLRCLFLERCALRSVASSRSAEPSQSMPLLHGPRRDLEELSLCELTRGSTVEPLDDLLSFFQHIGKLTVDRIPHWPLPRSSFPRPLPALSVETLVLKNASAGAVATALCHELKTHQNLSAVRELTVDRLTPGLLDFICAAPNLESLAFVADAYQSPINPGVHRASLRRITFITSFEFGTDYGYYTSTFRSIAAHIQALSAFGSISEIAIEFQVQVQDALIENPEFDLLAILQRALSPFGEWQAIREALKSYDSLQTLAFHVHDLATLSHDCVSILSAAAARHLPPKYVDMLRIMYV
ncbi:uncharacterized protein PHACADRAFT_266362 [Phanerochaete carnosa HHB-10118-sp]|uniref:F-box domain-containing protein n=1 Tax=Phanerochaete carnosa (strain HHB-10118-sp) TaxID=650164 RepID=K5VP02_PHACS|nr:uncharacterized protein PHACADRAFT_266362 [Phanerochaete carnosa HHB-10118-sp]EKM48440.1 hypothetical protein PHACADRAFT_266362 [Phanerochaete carnosa HHB-10118-sp]